MRQRPFGRGTERLFKGPELLKPWLLTMYPSHGMIQVPDTPGSLETPNLETHYFQVSCSTSGVNGEVSGLRIFVG